MIVLLARRLSLAPFSISDADELFQIRGDEAAMEFWDWPADATVEDTRAIARKMLEDIASGATRVWTMRRNVDSAFVGVVDLSEIAGHEADVGFMVRRDLWGQGYAFEATSAIIAQARAEGLARLRARIHADNVRSQRLLEKLGFAPLDAHDVEVRPHVVKRCAYFVLSNLP